ncbi:DUF2478 domain-containing protein [Alkalilacustris brevis]|uniref:DUF2478 domain-containing protein n=1 Tax=Alkalilacustris brevis TaxID=2026338 RepID=UPI000E0D257A|nr:DUF2478 domain-containing protein [Alkalilacustris brevis]
MELAFLQQDGRGMTDALLAAAVKQIQAARLALAGTVQSNPERADRDKCDMDLHVLPDGPVLRISQDLGRAARGCRLDLSALTTAVAETERHLPQAQLLVVNKFGKQEAGGRGFAPLIGEAMSRGIPVLVGVNPLNRSAFDTFTGGMAQPLPADPGLIADWAIQACRRPAA